MTFIKIRSHRRKFSNSDSLEQKKYGWPGTIEKVIARSAVHSTPNL
jgi:hypothetical protein